MTPDGHPKGHPDEFDPNGCPDCGDELFADAADLAFCPSCGWMEPRDWLEAAWAAYVAAVKASPEVPDAEA